MLLLITMFGLGTHTDQLNISQILSYVVALPLGWSALKGSIGGGLGTMDGQANLFYALNSIARMRGKQINANTFIPSLSPSPCSWSAPPDRSCAACLCCCCSRWAFMPSMAIYTHIWSRCCSRCASPARPRCPFWATVCWSTRRIVSTLYIHYLLYNYLSLPLSQ